MVFKIFDFIAAVAETIYDEVSGDNAKMQAQWIREVAINAEKNRRVCIQKAYDIWLQRNEIVKNKLFNDSCALMKPEFR